MNKYTFNWNLSPSLSDEHTVSVPPFEAIARDDQLSLSTSGSTADEPNLIRDADLVAHNLVRGFCYDLGKRFEITYSGYQRQSGQTTDCFVAVTGVGVVTLSGTADFEVRDEAGNIVTSSAMQREREQHARQQRLSVLARREARDANLRDMLDHWSRYESDPEGRLHSLFDILQVAERLYAGSWEKRAVRYKKIALALKMVEADITTLGGITNDETLLNGRHPGKSPGPHRIANEVEVANCERVARTIIEKYAETVII